MSTRLSVNLFTNFVQDTILPLTYKHKHNSNNPKRDYYLKLNLTTAGNYYFTESESAIISSEASKKLQEYIEKIKNEQINPRELTKREIKKITSLYNRLNNLKIKSGTFEKLISNVISILHPIASINDAIKEAKTKSSLTKKEKELSTSSIIYPSAKVSDNTQQQEISSSASSCSSTDDFVLVPDTDTINYIDHSSFYKTPAQTITIKDYSHLAFYIEPTSFFVTQILTHSIQLKNAKPASRILSIFRRSTLNPMITLQNELLSKQINPKTILINISPSEIDSKDKVELLSYLQLPEIDISTHQILTGKKGGMNKEEFISALKRSYEKLYQHINNTFFHSNGLSQEEYEKMIEDLFSAIYADLFYDKKRKIGFSTPMIPVIANLFHSFFLDKLIHTAGLHCIRDENSSKIVPAKFERSVPQRVQVNINKVFSQNNKLFTEIENMREALLQGSISDYTPSSKIENAERDTLIYIKKRMLERSLKATKLAIYSEKF